MKRRDLSGDEHALWKLATRDVKPARKRAANANRSSPEEDGSGKPKKKPAVLKDAPSARVTRDLAERTTGAAPLAASRKRVPAALKRDSPAPVLGGGDPKADLRAAKGLIPTEASLDLHGMTQASAHTRVTRFILGAQADGLRLVLVITGKGAGKSGEGRGIIRARFIDWVETAPLRASIARVAPAKPKDGGGGAFYVFLKRKTRG